jgi:hypothetical protein
VSAYSRVCQPRLDPYFLRELWLEEPDAPQQSRLI